MCAYGVAGSGILLRGDGHVPGVTDDQMFLSIDLKWHALTKRLALNISVGWTCIEIGFLGNERKYQNIRFIPSSGGKWGSYHLWPDFFLKLLFFISHQENTLLYKIPYKIHLLPAHYERSGDVTVWICSVPKSMVLRIHCRYHYL
jgi:hypothetical protein